MNSVYDIIDSVEQPIRTFGSRMNHEVPKADVVDRVDYILKQCQGKTVLDIGCAGTDGQATLFKAIRKVAKEAWGLDSQECQESLTFSCDVDRLGPELDGLPIGYEQSFDLVVAGEVLEHLSNPGAFLATLSSRWSQSQLIITVPNALSHVGLNHARKGIEHVNIDHVAWYSWRTLKTLVERCGYRVVDFHWYNGMPMFAEGLIFLCERNDDGQDDRPPASEAGQADQAD